VNFIITGTKLLTYCRVHSYLCSTKAIKLIVSPLKPHESGSMFHVRHQSSALHFVHMLRRVSTRTLFFKTIQKTNLAWPTSNKELTVITRAPISMYILFPSL
jgi:hypothetical protein